MKVATVENGRASGQHARAIARQADAQRDRRAKTINAEAEYRASSRLAKAADVISLNPTTLQLRYLQTLRSGS